MVYSCFRELSLIFLCILANFAAQSLRKVVVPSVYTEWTFNKPAWTSLASQKEYGYSIFLYQKTNSSAPNFIRTNRGTEGGVYLRFIVDHYQNFPDFAIFVHAAPEVHQLKYNWLNMVKCIKPDATYVSLNSMLLNRQPSEWQGYDMLMEQCWRDVLKIVWGYKHNNISDREQLMKRLPRSKPIEISAPCCQQFILSRNMVLSRPLEMWKKLHNIIAVEEACHRGDPQYSMLYSYYKTKKKLSLNEGSRTSNDGNTTGKLIQGGTMEALAHVVFGQKPLISGMPSNEEYCKHFMDGSVCSGSPCDASRIE